VKTTNARAIVLSLAAAPAAWADHMSIWGEGWANMPNDTHDTRIDTMDDDDAFLEYVQSLSGSNSVDVAPTASGMSE
jgi:hypothetical protein